MTMTIQDNNSISYVVKDGRQVMGYAINVLQILGKHKKVILKGRGETITSAVTVANIVTERLLKGNSKVERIVLNSDIPKTMGRMISTIQITLTKS
ncbi:MAG: DNA/RNA-binding protein AlbA [Cenarchaeum symbiont of Oopsacas minuta]|nr:DNA/RNA-binding protein AlbA [Cenarchaeum symbiont of Oopsacas minuta]